VIRIAVTAAAYAAIRDSLPAGSRPYELQRTANANFFIWVPNDTLHKLEALRGPSVGLSDVIVRLAAAAP
jgi:hypothetical protein